MKTIEVSAVLMIPVLLFGMFGNLSLLSATYRFKQLRNRNGILVALIAFLDSISELHESKNAIEVLSGKSLMPRSVCFRSIFLYLVSFNMACIAILFLAIDRFIAVWSPLSYRTIRTKHFILVTITVGLAYAIPIATINFVAADDKLIEPCNPPMSYTIRFRVIRNYIYLAITMLVIILNAISYLIIHSAKKKQKQNTCTFSSAQIRS
ncbi:unnamed protein product [Gongylonema pulchrum]|uniref:G_PROTEIN_RECEP_F1_2 domain-containing protein n=1 Tax=Gongylonema pulchrum TaxID=637853 RepID=A0A183DWU6_9BILA|nr:unnamed protein product [Gongylonema pulchrum]